MKRKTLLLATASAGVWLATPVMAQQSIKVGNLNDLTGATSSSGKFMGAGKADAFNWINKNGGINGKMIEFDSVDYSYKTDRAIQQYKKWKDDGVVAVEGYGTNDTEAMVGFIAQDKIPYFSMSFSGHLTDPAGLSARAKAGKVKPAPYNFFIAASYSDGNRALLMWAAEDWKKKGGQGKPKYIHMGDNHPYPLAPKEAGEELAKELGFDVAPSIQYSLGGGDFKAQCLALQASGANYAYLANTTGSNIAVMRSCATVGVNVQFMSNVWGMDEAGMKAAGKAADGVVFVLGQEPWGADVPGMKLFKEISAMSDPTGKLYRPMPYATAACHVLVLAEAMKIADKKGNLNGPGIKDALETMTNFVPYNAQGMCQSVTWTPTDHRGVDLVTIGRVKINGDTETGEVNDLMEKGTMKIDTVARIKVERKPGWHGY